MDHDALKLAVRPLTPARWPHFETLFGSNGACAGCWCMYWRRDAQAHKAGQGAGNRAAMKRLVNAAAVPGLLAYAGREPVGWLALAPRTDYPRLANSRVLAPVDARPVWSVSCFFVRRDWRGRGVSSALLRAALAHARKVGAEAVEGYPVDRADRTGDAFVWTGIAATFRAAGFVEVARRSETRPIMRYEIRS